jgi:hypothetical protein
VFGKIGSKIDTCDKVTTDNRQVSGRFKSIFVKIAISNLAASIKGLAAFCFEELSAHVGQNRIQSR